MGFEYNYAYTMTNNFYKCRSCEEQNYDLRFPTTFPRQTKIYTSYTIEHVYKNYIYKDVVYKDVIVKPNGIVVVKTGNTDCCDTNV